MTGAELLALARHHRGASEGDGHIALAMVSALQTLWWVLTPKQRAGLSYQLCLLIDVKEPLTNS